MKLLFLLLCVTCLAADKKAQPEKAPLASFTGTVKTIHSGNLTLARPDQEDMDITCTRKTRYYADSKQIKQSAIKPGNQVTVETTLDPLLKPEAVTVRILPIDKTTNH